jgi:hypothetical protein
MKLAVYIPILIILVIAFIGLSAVDANAESSILQDAINDGIGGLGDTIDGSIDGSDLDDATKNKLYSVSRAGIDSADLFANAWFSAHEFVVQGLLAGSPVELPVALITMVSVGISTALLFIVFKEIFKKAKWIILIVVGVILVLLALGSSPSF